MTTLHNIMEEHSVHLLRLAYFYTKNHHAAEDIVQDVFIKFAASSYEERGQLAAYLRKMTVNRSKDYLKSWAYKKLILQETFAAIPVRRRDTVVEAEERSYVADAVLSLPIHYREVIIFYYFEEMTTANIAALLGEPESTIRTRLRRAREKLKPLLQNEWEVLL